MSISSLYLQKLVSAYRQSSKIERYIVNEFLKRGACDLEIRDREMLEIFRQNSHALGRFDISSFDNHLKDSANDRTKLVQIAEEYYKSSKFEDYSFGNPYWCDIFQNFIDALLVSVRELYNIKTNFKAFAFLPISTPNACAFRVPNTEDHVIVFNDEFPKFANKISKIICILNSCIPFHEYGKVYDMKICDEIDLKKFETEYSILVNKSIDLRPDIVEYFFHTFTSMIFDEELFEIKSPIVNSFTEHARSSLLNGIELWLCGHEIGHIINNDCIGNVLTRKQHKYDLEIEQIIIDKNREYIADMVGFALMYKCITVKPFKSYDSYCMAVALSSPDVYLIAIETLYKFLFCAREKDYAESETHPAPLQRKERIEILRTSLASDADDILLFANKKSMEASLIFEKLFERVQIDFINIINRGKEISNKWGG